MLRIGPDGTRTTLVTSPGQEVGAVSNRGKTIYWATTGQDPAAPAAALWSQRKGGQPRQIADLRAFEEAKNPDQRTTYGFKNLPQSCADQFPADNPASYTGLVDSHPYASYAARNKVFVADAGANAILSVRTDKRHAKPKVVATLPAVSTTVSAEALAAQGLPACAAGYKYRFEFVPTDVEKGGDGKLYVTSLPGGPEDASLGRTRCRLQDQP
ncbi:ScyD/ScyE family protein [Aeromicrobium sp. UC242_57]|uniref:ScyD/ScyE family protein n=1 Tax=Aeromicrobium sp. UC242_57 TaxID=3374624 RepID=UPI00378F71EF